MGWWIGAGPWLIHSGNVTRHIVIGLPPQVAAPTFFVMTERAASMDRLMAMRPVAHGIAE